MRIRCRTCKAELPGYEFAASGGSPIGFRMSAAFEQVLEESTEAWDGTENWFQCRYLDAFPCFECGTVELTTPDPALMLKFDGQDWSKSGPDCPVCKLPCRGPRSIEGEATGESLLAHLAAQFGAPLVGRLCSSCWRVWPSLDPDDAEGRRELAARFPDGGPCSRCQGRLRITHLDVPHAGVAHLGHPSDPVATRRLEWEESQLRVSGCDSCGEATVLIANHEPKARRRKQE